MQTLLQRKFVFLGLLLLLGLGLLIAAAYSAPERADESYYVIIFAAQRSSNVPRYSHTFATFVKATAEGDDENRIEPHTISWIASALEVNLVRTKPEAGVNLDLPRSLRLAESLNESVSMYGPYEIKKELYDRALKQIDHLESGAVEYKALDTRFRPEAAINCIHAVADVDADDGLLQTGTARGEEASRMVAEHLRRWMIHPEKTHEWVAERLGLDKHPITHRDWSD